ncbi:hypothetical protein, partial [Trinickia caryophylli]|uniref:hypothetical protein n=1 Tax=Trinickia caryophylli TaxID=28094 RepID=UPI001E5FC491
SQYSVRLDTFASSNPEGFDCARHQVPTLIGCELLKITSLNTAVPTFRTARLALLHQQQRSEIMQSVSLFVNRFFASLLASPIDSAVALRPSTYRAQTSHNASPLHRYNPSLPPRRRFR